MNLDTLLRPNIRDLKPYSSARDELAVPPEILLDANEWPFETGYQRYPDPRHTRLRHTLASWREVAPQRIFTGHGSDEVIDLLIRAFCEPGKDQVVVLPPTYGMYAVSAAINGVGVVEVPLQADFQPDLPAVQSALVNPRNKLIFLCSPNNPTGNLMQAKAVYEIAKAAPGLVVVDEAYIDFTPTASFLHLENRPPNLIILQTLSKLAGLADLRIGLAIADTAIVEVLDRIKPPYNLSQHAQNTAVAHVSKLGPMEVQYATLRREQRQLARELAVLPCVAQVFPSHANFLLVRFTNAAAVQALLLGAGIAVRNREEAVAGTLRISIGTPEQNRRLLETLQSVTP